MNKSWIAGAFAALAIALLPGGVHGVGLAGTWSTTGSLRFAREQHAATLLYGGAVLATGGENCDTNPCTPLATAEVYVPSTGKWITVHSMSTARINHTATLLYQSGQVLIAGGSSTCTPTCNALASAELYNPKTAAFTPTGTMKDSRQGFTATWLRTGQVLIAGGQGDCAPTCTLLASAELYNPSTGTFTPTGSMTTARQNHTATLLPNGQVLVTGGWGCKNGGGCSSAELYNPSTGTWTATAGSMSDTRIFHTATLLPTGQVLVAGGVVGCNYGCSTVATAELYNPSTGTFTTTGSMSTARYLHTATLLYTGKVLVTGGGDGYGSGALASAELYDPTSGTWTTTGSMHATRASHTATLLISGAQKGQVLIAGGYNFQNSANTYNSAEVYHP